MYSTFFFSLLLFIVSNSPVFRAVNCIIHGTVEVVQDEVGDVAGVGHELAARFRRDHRQLEGLGRGQGDRVVGNRAHQADAHVFGRGRRRNGHRCKRETQEISSGLVE